MSPIPDPDDIGRGLAELEQYVADHAPVSVADDRPQSGGGQTKRVRRLRAEVAEAHQLAALQDDDTPLLVDTPKVRRMRLRAAEAARLHELSRDPMMRAYKAARMRRLFVAGLVAALALALAWSTVGVQKFAADGARAGSAAWLFAWLVEPFISLALLGVVGSRAYLAVQGSPLTDSSEDTARRIEWLFLALSLGMNAYPYLPGVADPFELHRLVLHVLGPIVAVAVVMYLPIVLKGFTDLDHGATASPYLPPTGPSYRRNAPAQGGGNPPPRVDIDALTARARHLIALGRLPAEPSASALRPALGCSTDAARAVRDALRDQTS